MKSPGDALTQRFLSTARDRLTQTSEALSNLTGDNAEIIKRIGRDLHTFKGEARLLGLTDIERLAHAAEDVLFGHQKAGTIGSETQALLFEALDVMFLCVQSRQEGSTLPAEDVDQLVARLLAGAGEAAAAAHQPAATPAPSHAEAAEAPEGAPAPSAKAKESEPQQGHEGRRSLRVSTELIDRVTDLLAHVSGALVRSRQYLGELSLLADELHGLDRQREAGKLRDDDEKRNRNVLTRQNDILRELREHHFRMDLSFSELTEKVRAARLQPLKTVFDTYPPFVREAARKEGKKIDVKLVGADLSVDQQVLEQIAEPCLHLLRNAVAHGIETADERRGAGKPEVGSLVISARPDGELVRIEFADDGRGIDVERVKRRAIAMGVVDEARAEAMSTAEAVKLIFTPGLSTAATTTELAGRGVGLDVVQNIVDRMGGVLTTESIQGVGTKFILLVPVSLSLSRAMLLRAADQVFALPNSAVVEVFRLAVKDIQSVEGREVTRYRDRLLPLVRLREALGLRGIKDIFVNAVGVVILRAGDEIAGFVVDDFLGEREIVARPFGEFIGRAPMTSGVTLTESGEVVVILHAPDLLRSVHESARPRGGQVAAAGASGERRILYAEDSIITREYAANVLRTRGFHVTEAADGLEALELLKKEKFDALLTDLQMPRLDGFKLCATVRKDPRLKNMPIVVMSTLDTPETKRMALDAGADSYLVKSDFAADRLVSIMQQVIR